MAKLKEKEHDIQRAILDYLSLREIFHWRNNSGAVISQYKGKTRFIRYGAVGSPDIFAVKNGVCYGIEVKSSTGIQSDAQKSFEKSFVSAGGIYILARNLDDVAGVI